MQGNLHVRFGVDLLISNEIGKLGHCFQWAQFFLCLEGFTFDLKKLPAFVIQKY